MRRAILAERQHGPKIGLPLFTQARINLRQFRDDDVDRPAVANDVMGSQRQRVSGIGEFEQPRPNRRPFDEVERRRRVRLQIRGQDALRRAPRLGKYRLWDRQSAVSGEIVIVSPVALNRALSASWRAMILSIAVRKAGEVERTVQPQRDGLVESAGRLDPRSARTARFRSGSR